MIAIHKMRELKELFYNTCELLRALEDEHPYPNYSSNAEDWEDEIREIWSTVLGDEPSKKEQQVLEAVLQVRHQSAHTARKAVAARLTIEPSAWEWLLTTQQQEQRTDEWIREKVDLLTASEIADIWAGPGTRARLVLSKVPPIQVYPQRHAVRRSDGHAMDWGIRFEPVVKQHLEHTLNITITDLGRIRHPTFPRLAASPDGLITKGSPELVGRLVEIKCPPSRPITGEIPFAYLCQMQVQMAVCNLPACEYVEVKFQIVESEAQGWITYIEQKDTYEGKYIYHDTPLPPKVTGDMNVIETYGWVIQQVHRVTVMRDEAWLTQRQPDLDAFWNDVDAARAGTFVPPPPRQRKVKDVVCAIMQDDDS